LLFLHPIMGLKSIIANSILNSKLSSFVREKKVFNLDSAKSAGVLWELNQKESYDQLQMELSNAGIKTTSLCYFHFWKTVIPEEIIGFSRRQTNWLTEIPNIALTEDFIHQKFDLLIDLTGQKHLPIVYITALSEATFKIGYAGNTQNYFDLNIDFPTAPDTKQLTEQILYYLKRINKTTIE